MHSIPNRIASLVDVYPYRSAGDDREYLLLRRSPGAVYAGEWRMIGGKVEVGEAAWEAAVRELEEETARTPVALWAIPSVNIFYEWNTDAVYLIPAFAAEIDGDPKLNHEHNAFVWCNYEAAVERLRWPEQRRLLGIVHEELDREIPVSWRVM